MTTKTAKETITYSVDFNEPCTLDEIIEANPNDLNNEDIELLRNMEVGDSINIEIVKVRRIS